MSGKTPNVGLEYLDPGDPLSSDGYSFGQQNPQITDRLFGLLLAATTVADPTTAPVLATASTGGAIPAAMTIYIVYTLLDGRGGETLPVDSSSVATDDGYLDPDAAPTTVLAFTAGSLLVGNYDYAVTVTDGLGGETVLSPNAAVLMDPGHANAEITLSGLSAITSDASGSDAAAGWRLWRRIDGGQWYLIATGATGTDTFLDDGSVGGDCTVEPPLSTTTVGANTISVTVPSTGQPLTATGFNLYASLDSSFTSPALIGAFSSSDFDAAQTVTSLDGLVAGSPPAVNSTWGSGGGGGGGGTGSGVIYYEAGPVVFPPLGSGDVATLNSLDAGTVTDAALRTFAGTYAVGSFAFKAGMSLTVDIFAKVEGNAADGAYCVVWAVFDQADPVDPSTAPSIVGGGSTGLGALSDFGSSDTLTPVTDGILYAFLLCGEYDSLASPGSIWTGAPTVPASALMQKAIFRVH